MESWWGGMDMKTVRALLNEPTLAVPDGHIE